MLHVMPRHGKSELASRHFPAYYLGHHPHRQFISASASASLASDFGRDVRNIIASPEYGKIFNTRLAEDSQAKDKWNTSEGGSYYAVGIGGALMGRGAHVLLVDDPFGSMAEARSEVERKRVWDWFTGTAYNRLEDGGAIIVINHRMHEDDLSGKLLAQQAAGGDKWEVVELAIDENCTPLWPEKYDREALLRIKRNISAADWSALYRQNPTPDEGTYFSAEWFKPYVEIPDRKTLTIYGASDYAVTSNGGDYTVHIVVGIDPEDRIYVLDLWRQQAASDVWVEAWCDLVAQWKPVGWAEENGQIRGSVGPFLQKRALERKAYVARAQFPTKGDKAIRAQSIRGRASMGKLYVPINAEWYPDFRAEMLSFPAGKHDDQVDAMGLIGQVLDRMVPGRPLPSETADKVISTDPASTTVTMNDLWEAEERKHKRQAGRA